MSNVSPSCIHYSNITFIPGFMHIYISFLNISIELYKQDIDLDMSRTLVALDKLFYADIIRKIIKACFSSTNLKIAAKEKDRLHRF